MRKLAVFFGLILLISCSGCAGPYVIKLSNGSQITTKGKPKLKGAKYYFKDAAGRENWVYEGRVREIMPASMAKEEKAPFMPSSR